MVKRDTWDRIGQQILESPGRAASPIDPNELDAAFASNSLQVTADYRDLIVAYGGVLVGGTPIFGMHLPRLIDPIMGMTTAIELTQWFRVLKWPQTDEWLVFRVDNGDAIGLDRFGKVWVSDQTHFKQVVKVAETFEEFLRRWCLHMDK